MTASRNRGGHSEAPLQFNEYEIRSADGKQGIVRVGELKIDVHWPGHERQTYSFSDLVERARREALPAWAKQVPVLVARIEVVFQREREQGKDPYFKIGINGDEAFYENLRHGTRIVRKLSDLKADLGRGRMLPEIYNVPAIRAALGLEPA